MKSLLAIVLTMCLLFTGCTQKKPNAIMVDGELYLLTGKVMPVAIGESAVLGIAKPVMTQTGYPTEDGQINFPCESAKYARISDGVHDGIVVLIDNEWVYFEAK